jgi:hypothetical protein
MYVEQQQKIKQKIKKLHLSHQLISIYFRKIIMNA